ncbi:MAG: glutamine--fructose-6-phosphate transaminase (isomerizing) [Actinobacteria bacterium]|nr:MAG: glutamine--fructose-6-phosphate transaminase (isomerizing) [Actinomycetota bacterium]TML82344.1 MAG: glutamine--fructose-6-phosphate transaminase (isomerizing) [Actinomycetota bacterium]
MCGIIGYVGSRAAKELLLHGLERLEYRGYDSAGIALRENGSLEYVRAVGNLQFLKDAAGPNGSQSNHGLGHTRWATHGAVNEQNAHPLTGCEDGRLAIVLNGIVENYRELKESLEAEGHRFSSETDAEVVVHLVEHNYDGDLVEAVQATSRRLEGHFAFVVIHYDQPDLLVGTRRQCPLVVGVGDGEMFLASSIAAFLRETRKVQLIEDGEVVAITPEGSRFFTDEGEVVHKDVEPIDWDDESAVKGGYETFMLKEIYEQPEAVRETIGDRARRGKLVLEGIGLNELEIQNLRRIVIVACGTAYHAAVTGRYIIEEWARVPVEPDIASEWRYRNPVLSKDTLVIGITQSGETADTIAAMRLAREQGARTLAITNQLGTQITREVDAVLYTRAGLEISVAATKTFTAQVALLSLIALKLAQIRRTLPAEEIEFILEELFDLPEKMEQFLDGDHPIEEIAQRHYNKPFFLYLGRHIGLPVALEGALKLKEISYIPTEAYSAGEMKHGPIALLDSDTPVVCIAIDQKVVYDKVVSNIQEVRARGAQVIAIATDGNEDIQHHADDVVYIPRTPAFLQAVLAVLPLQLLAYRIARLRGLNVDQPRNLAKTVTVE